LLCDLECKSIKEATQQLGWPQGTLAGRLARARKMLAKRLTQRGVVLSGGALAVVLTEKAASASVPLSLVASTTKAAVTIAAGQAVAASLVSAKVAALMEGVMKGMMLTKLKAVTVALLMLGLVAFGGNTAFRHSAAAQQVEAPKSPTEGGKAANAEAQDKAQNAHKGTAKSETKRASRNSPVTPLYVVEPPDVLLVEIIERSKESQETIEQQCLVRPDGTVSLGANGSVHVAGHTLKEIRAAIADHIAPNTGKDAKIEIHVDVIAYNSRAYYVIAKGKDGEQVRRCPDTGGETVVGAILRVDGLALRATKGRVWLVSPAGENLEVDWRAITQEGKSDTNYVLQSGDRVYVESPLAK
jgi:protein involved in polysaccharide export with SLBB domain